MVPNAWNQELIHALGRFGWSTFRPGQAEVIAHVLAGNDCLCVMPTGGGKSLCYQLPAVMRKGLTIVISPLIALMKDQVDALCRKGIPATLINSSLPLQEQNQRLQHVAEGHYRLLYVAPERLRSQKFFDMIRTTPVQLLAIDEAHCISEWGHDFRPDYARLGRFREILGGVQTIALTATATPRVREDIVTNLGLKSAKQFVTGFARSNLYFGSKTFHSDRDKDQALLHYLETRPGAGIIYASTRKRCESVVEMLKERSTLKVDVYHAGLQPEDRKSVQDRFMRGDLDAIVATNAFGMGIDKSDIRFVIHYNMPGTLEAYYQEAGRAGRDGQPSVCMLLFSYQDRYIHEYFIENAHPSREFVQKVYEYLCKRPEDLIELTLEEIRDALDSSYSTEAVSTALKWVARTEVIDRLEAGAGLAMIRISSDLPTLVDLLPKESRVQRRVLQVVERAIGDRRYEPVYVHPAWMMQQAELDKEALQRALRELCKLEAIEYVPPFRGRAIHFRKRGISFDQLGIDFQTLAKRKAAEYEKLESTIEYAQSRQCRQLAILKYFGDPSAQPCGICDRCQELTGWPTLSSTVHGPRPTKQKSSLAKSKSNREVTPSELKQIDTLNIEVLKAIQQLRGRLGKTIVSQFLCGSESAQLKRLGLPRLSGFGLLKPMTQGDAKQLIEALLQEQFLLQREPERKRPVLDLGDRGRQAIDGKTLPSDFIKLDRKLFGRLLSIALRCHVV